MSPHSKKRSAWTSTAWLWIFLAICFIGWRVSSRVDQYHPSVARAAQQAQVSFFDSNERNLASLDAARSHSRAFAAQVDPLFAAVPLPPRVDPTRPIEREPRTELPPIYVDSVSLFSNPPPISLI